jgi:hypothetical protein
MPSQRFYLLGNPVTSAIEVEIESSTDLDGLKHLVAAYFAIVEPNGKQREAEFSITPLPITHSLTRK